MYYVNFLKIKKYNYVYMYFYMFVICKKNVSDIYVSDIYVLFILNFI